MMRRKHHQQSRRESQSLPPSTLQLGGDGEKLAADPHPLIAACIVMCITHRVGVVWHHLIRSSAEGGGDPNTA
jgi:hypothetical protein